VCIFFSPPQPSFFLRVSPPPLAVSSSASPYARAPTGVPSFLMRADKGGGAGRARSVVSSLFCRYQGKVVRISDFRDLGFESDRRDPPGFLLWVWWREPQTPSSSFGDTRSRAVALSLGLVDGCNDRSAPSGDVACPTCQLVDISGHSHR